MPTKKTVGAGGGGGISKIIILRIWNWFWPKVERISKVTVHQLKAETVSIYK